MGGGGDGKRSGLRRYDRRTDVRGLVLGWEEKPEPVAARNGVELRVLELGPPVVDFDADCEGCICDKNRNKNIKI